MSRRGRPPPRLGERLRCRPWGHPLRPVSTGVLPQRHVGTSPTCDRGRPWVSGYREGPTPRRNEGPPELNHAWDGTVAGPGPEGVWTEPVSVQTCPLSKRRVSSSPPS